MNKHERKYKVYKSRLEAIVFEDEYWSESMCYKSELAEAFLQYGWSFVKCLWEALRHADVYNSELIIKTRKNYTEEYFNKFIKWKWKE